MKPSEALKGLRHRAYYIVEVQHRPGNPTHRAILYTGHDPSQTDRLFNGNYECCHYDVARLHSLRVLREIDLGFDLP